MKYLSRSLEIYGKIGHLRGEASVYSKIGNYYKIQEDYKSAIGNYEKSISIYETLNEESKLDDLYSSTGICYVKLKEYQNAKEYFEKSLELDLNIENKLNLAEVYINLNKFDTAIEMSKTILEGGNAKRRSKYLAHIFISISLFSLDKEVESYANIGELIRYHSTNKFTSDEIGWDFSDLATTIQNLESSKRILIEDLISLIENKTTCPAIRIDQVNIECEKSDDYAEVFHPFVGRKTIAKDDDSLEKVIKNLSKENIEINIDESAVMGIERDIALMTLGFLHKKGFIDFNEIAPNILKIGLTDLGREKIPKSSK